ncbi:MAG: hypothetical protein L6365_05635 [Desulfobulbaceae bacterium]|nr:hypothetical protein [Pseudomonadota bacterium]MCG2746994.1 hypothetical protein [Desulfobulbaceae bacterium]
MEANRRQIKKLHLRTHDDGTIHRYVALLEDAFNIASLTGLPSNGLVLIRHLNLGDISHLPSSTSLSQHIDAQIRLIAGSAVRINEEDLPSAEVVWFDDYLSPYLGLTGLVARGKTPRAWYWQKAVPAWNPSATPSRAILNLIEDAVERSGQKLASALIVDRLVQLNHEEKLLDHLTPQDAQILLQLVNIYPCEISRKEDEERAIVPVMPMRTVWRHTLRRWIGQWGPRDNRSLWLMANAILCYNPAYIDNPFLVDVSNRCVDNIHRNIVERKIFREKASAPSVTTSPPTPKTFHSRDVKNIDGKEHHDPKLEPHAINDIAFETEQNGSSPEPEISKHSVEVSSRDTPQDKHHQKYSDLQDSSIEPEHSETNRLLSTRHDAESVDVKHHAVAKPYPVIKEGVERAKVFIQPTGQTQEQTACVESQKRDFRHQEFAFTVHAGFLFVVGLLARLDIEDVLKSQPQFADINLPAHILWTLANRLHIEGEDPVCSFLSQPPPVCAEDEFDFVAPQQWISLLDHNYTNEGSRVLKLAITDTEKHILFDSKNEILLATWRHRQPEQLSSWRQTHEIVSGPGIPAADFHYIIAAFLGIMTLFLERWMDMDMQTLVNREGFIATTKTHVDVFFDLQDTDVRVRRAGLDIDPGWVPWLGKVIQYHYQEKGNNHV